MAFLHYFKLSNKVWHYVMCSGFVYRHFPSSSICIKHGVVWDCWAYCCGGWSILWWLGTLLALYVRVTPWACYSSHQIVCNFRSCPKSHTSDQSRSYPTHHRWILVCSVSVWTWTHRPWWCETASVSWTRGTRPWTSASSWHLSVNFNIIRETWSWRLLKIAFHK